MCVNVHACVHACVCACAYISMCMVNSHDIATILLKVNLLNVFLFPDNVSHIIYTIKFLKSANGFKEGCQSEAVFLNQAQIHSILS